MPACCDCILDAVIFASAGPRPLDPDSSRTWLRGLTESLEPGCGDVYDVGGFGLLPGAYCRPFGGGAPAMKRMC